ncbi:MAG: hypothetical protein IJ730_00715, partial [Alphaproteobacteria bacterium]|nr:hypothetical protein [Alphaproteobacteria bacterium]
MSLIRGIRTIAQEYSRSMDKMDNSIQHNESYILLEAGDDEDCIIKIVNSWPKNIELTARMIPEFNFDNSVCVEVNEDGKNLGKTNIYLSPSFHSTSEIKNKNNICSKLILKYEGTFGIDQKDFFGDASEDFEIKFFEDKIILKKEFLTQHTSIIEPLNKTTYPIYPYGGFFEYGAHPKEIESCIFQTKSENLKSTIRSWKFTRFVTKFG